MAYWVQNVPARNTNDSRFRSYIADGSADISTLPTSIAEGTGGLQESDNFKCAIGSDCLTLDGELYILNSKNQWISI